MYCARSSYNVATCLGMTNLFLNTGTIKGEQENKGTPPQNFLNDGMNSTIPFRGGIPLEERRVFLYL